MEQKRKRLLAGFLALLCLGIAVLATVHTNVIVSQASTFRGKNIWANGSEVLQGRNRNWLYRWTDGWQMTFCICPRNHMGSTVTATPLLTNINDTDIPYIKSKEDYEKLAIMCTWFDTHGSVSADNATYAAVQAAIWAIMEDGWETADSVARIVDKHVAGTYERWKEVKAYVENTDNGDSSLPDWCSASPVSGKAQPMILADGVWTTELDVSSNPRLATLNWVFEGDSAGWTKSVADGKMKLSYVGGSQQPMTLSAVLPNEMKGFAKNTTSLNFFIPNGDRNTIQAMISSGPYEAKLYIHLSFTPGSGTEDIGAPEVRIYRHEETFKAHYNLELKKNCAETGQALENSVFQVLEAFDKSRIGAGLNLEKMTPKPSSWENFKVCSEAVTDSGGYFSHTDEKRYEYSKTYCDGHPEPDYMEVPEAMEEEGEDNSDEIAAVEEANEEQRARWEALVAACEAETDFHGMEQGEGLEMMLQDRDRLYEEFIHLKYDYTVKETQARYGYLRHGLHPDDGKIPVVRMTSSEAGARCEEVGREVVVSQDAAAGASGFGGIGREIALEEGVSLPEPILDDVAWIEPFGTPDRIGYTFQVLNHRTEGEIHINKRDLELQKGDSPDYDSYGDTQGDATLEGAVYGLYAAENICHPDGKTGVIYRKDELAAIAATNKKGDASFLAYTEESPGFEAAKSPVKTWTGRPLILGQYYIKEIARSEGYELSVYGMDNALSNVHTDRAQAETVGWANVTTAMSHPVDMHDGSWLEFSVTCQDTAEGFQILISGYPEGALFYRSNQKETTKEEQVVIGSQMVATGEYERAAEGEYRLDKEGNYIPVLDSEGNIVWDTKQPVSRIYYAAQRLNYYPDKEAAPQVDMEKWEDMAFVDTAYIKKEADSMLEQKGYRLLDAETGQDAPWSLLELSGTTNRELVEEILDWFSMNSFWDSAAVHKIWQEEDQYKAIVFHDYQRLSSQCIYEAASGILYLKTPIHVSDKGERHAFVAYQEGEFAMERGYALILSPKQAEGEIPFPAEIETYLKPIYRPLYEQYQEGDYRLDGNGNRIPVYEREFIYGNKEQSTSDYELLPLDATYNPVTKAYTVHVDNRTDWKVTKTPVTETFRAVAPQTEILFQGRTMFYSDYLTDCQGAGASAFAPANVKEGSYIKFVPLTYPGQVSPMQDGEGAPGEGTRKNPASLRERIIKQSVKVTKAIENVFEGDAGGDNSQMGNFRFCVYLKSNLERLYRDEDGKIVWLDRWGQEIDVERFKGSSPALAPDFYTKQGAPDTGYTAILETIMVPMEDGDKERQMPVYNYRKFFQAMETANEDKWKDNNPRYTSYRPIGNEKNRTRYAIENSRSSDMVRQFAIDWYLEEEVKKLQAAPETPGDMAYGDERYDQALCYAIEKASDYLKPFFDYDLHSLYAIEWDCEAGGGKDKDKTTLSADLSGEGFCYGISTYLPYGTYVIVEQQPRYAKLADLPNRHYQVDEPKEITLPSVYAGYEASCQYPEEMSGYYLYDADMTPEEMREKYLIRFCEENRVVKAHSHRGDFEIYPFGRRLEGGRDKDGACAASENAGVADGVLFYGGTATENNPWGRYYKNQVPSMKGVQTAYDGLYASVLVPWSVTIPEDEKESSQPAPSGESRYEGFAKVKFWNLSYGARLRIEKLDGETHENILHDEAIFRIYMAKRDESENGTGKVRFYEKDTVISGSREFLESMGASNITSMARKRTIMEVLSARIKGSDEGPGSLYTGLVCAGTPICTEQGQICMINGQGEREGEFQAYTTIRNGLMKEAGKGAEAYGNQNTGYLETPQPLEAGAYVLAEVKPPAGYARAKPIAMEIYSDKITYYKEGNPQEHVLATIYKSPWENGRAFPGKPGAIADLARIYVENQPIKLKVEKRKEASKDTGNATEDSTVTWKISGRIDGSLTQIGNNTAYEYAFLNGDYQGYAWKKGTLEYLQALKEQGQEVDIVYHGSLFAGYGYLTRRLETAEGENPYVAGAKMTLYEGLELEPSGNEGDDTYKGLTVMRAGDQTVTRMYVEKGYAGDTCQFLPKAEEGQVVWRSTRVEREDTDILYYDFKNLDVFMENPKEGDSRLYGYDRKHEAVSLQALEIDKRNMAKTEPEYSIFAFQGGVPYLELAGGDFTQISYSQADKRFTGNFARLKRDLNGNYTFGEGMRIYHLDEEGSRDSLVDPDTGMAYILEEATGLGGGRKQRILVWPVNVARDGHGAITARDKITTFRPATLEENQEDKQSEDYPETGYLTGSWKPEAEEKSHRPATQKQNQKAQNLNGQPLFNNNTGSFEKTVVPILDSFGLVQYYQDSKALYHGKTPLYDRDGDFVREKSQDLLGAYNQAAYGIEEEAALEEGDIFHRQGEGYILENTWITGDRTPNDPFQDEITWGQADLLKRVPAGTYILEEVKAPDGYTKGFPAGVTVEERPGLQAVQMVDNTTKLMIGKIDGTSCYTYDILDMQSQDSQGKWKVIGTATEGKGAYGQKPLPGAELALYKASRVYTSNYGDYPKGSYLKKKEASPLAYASVKNGQAQTAQWVTAEAPLYVEGIPLGEYLLEETKVPSGFVPGPPVEVVIENTREVPAAVMYNDHTKMEIDKYMVEGGRKKRVCGAGFHLYPILEETPLRYDEANPVDFWKSCDASEYEGFITAFEEMYRDYGIQGEAVSWGDGRRAEQIGCDSIGPLTAGGLESPFPTTAKLRYRTEDGKEIRITVYGRQDNRLGRDFIFEYQFDYHALPHINEYAASYATVEGIRRFDYLPAGQAYALVETEPPPGFAKAEDLLIHIEATADIQRYGVLNQEGTLLISKTGEAEKQQLAGAWLALYRAAEDGALVQDNAHLVAKWVSGADGVYTELENINHQIPEGYSQGDIRLHALRRIPDGTYYLVELQAPDFYMAIEPIKIEYRQQEGIPVIHAVNSLERGELEIEKADSQGNYLAGAVFQLEAYRKADLKTPVFTKAYSCSEGVLKITDLEIGEAGENGEVTPYVYQFKEVTPPEGCQVDGKTYTFEFKPGEVPRQSLKLVNHKTSIRIQKKDFEAAGDKNGESAFIEGAELAVYRATGRGLNGGYLYDEEVPLFTWVTKKGETSKVLEGLAAGQTYVLVERKAPKGYDLMKPVAFTISMDGRRIMRFGNASTAVMADQDPIHTLTIQGRYGVKVEMCVADSTGKEIAAWTAGGDGFLLPPSEEVPEGEVCTITETTVYSDGSRLVTGRTIKPLFWENGICRIPDRTIQQVCLELVQEDGTQIGAYTPTEADCQWTVKNMEAPETLKIEMYQRESPIGNPLNPEQEVFNRITYVNTSGYAADLKLLVTADKNTQVIDGGDGLQESGGWLYEIKDVKPLEGGSILLVTEVEETAFQSEIKAELTACPAAEADALPTGKGKTWISEKIVPILQKGKLTVFQELTGTGKELHESEESMFEIHLYTPEGEELKGIYSYQGSKTGSLRSGEKVPLGGNQYITIEPGRFYPDFRYKVIRQEDEREVISWNTEGQGGQETGACAVFTRSETDATKRTPLIEGRGYVLRETTLYSDGARRLSNQLQFMLNNEAMIDAIAGFDRRNQVMVSKEDIAGRKTPGAVLQVLDEKGQVLEEWLSGVEPYKLSVVLERGKTYLCREVTPPAGYAYSPDIPFATSEEGISDYVVMVDKNTQVQFRKTDITGEVEIPGAYMQILDSEKKVVESWLSTETPYEITGKLIAGDEYILHEEYAPKGYAYAADIPFTVPADGKTGQVEMKDKPTHVIIRKTDITGEKDIPGAWLQIIGPDKAVVEEWESGAKPYEIIGKLEAGKEYVLHEKYAPKGYAYASDIVFMVSKDGNVDQVVMKDKATYVSIGKTEITGEKRVAGAALQILDQKGEVVEAWISGLEPHVLAGQLNAGETYTLHEEYAPSGYACAEDVTFTVSEDGKADQISMKDDITKLEVIKINKKSRSRLAGARLRLVTKLGQVVEEWVSTESAHKIYGKLIAGEEYQIQEVEAPSGYRILSKSIPITIPKSGELASVTVENRKKPGYPPKDDSKDEPPDVPEAPEEPRIGKIFASYKTRLSSKGTLTFGGLRKLKTPKTGDERKNRIMAAGILWVLSIIGMAGFGRFHRKQKKTITIDAKIIFITGLFLAAFSGRAEAEEVVKSKEAEITVTWEPFIETLGVPMAPGQAYEYGGQAYSLKSCQIVPAMTDERREEASETVVYEAVEQTDTLPEEIEFQVTDQETGQAIKAELPVLRTSFTNWRWVTGFQFPITVQQYDAGLFYLGDIVVEGREDSPFLEYKAELLDFIDVNPEFYSIEEITWASQPWTGEDGLVYRQAVASGKKYVADCHAVYGGIVTIPSAPASAWQAVYVKNEKEAPSLPEATDAGFAGEEAHEEKIHKQASWVEIMKKIVRITIKITFFIVFLVVLAIFWKRRKGERKRKGESAKVLRKPFIK